MAGRGPLGAALRRTASVLDAARRLTRSTGHPSISPSPVVDNLAGRLRLVGPERSLVVLAVHPSTAVSDRCPSDWVSRARAAWRAGSPVVHHPPPEQRTSSRGPVRVRRRGRHALRDTAGAGPWENSAPVVARVGRMAPGRGRARARCAVRRGTSSVSTTSGARGPFRGARGAGRRQAIARRCASRSRSSAGRKPGSRVRAGSHVVSWARGGRTSSRRPGTERCPHDAEVRDESPGRSTRPDRRPARRRPVVPAARAAADVRSGADSHSARDRRRRSPAVDEVLDGVLADGEDHIAAGHVRLVRRVGRDHSVSGRRRPA